MSNRERIDKMLMAVRVLWNLNPDLHFFPLLSRFTSLGNMDSRGNTLDPCFYDDDEVLEELKSAVSRIQECNEI